MQSCHVLFVAFLLPALAAAAEVTPVQKVLEMMSAMKTKGEDMKADEEKVYAEYKEWVDDETTKHTFEIRTADMNIESLTAFITKTDSDVAQLADAIQDLDNEISRLEAEKKDATDERNSEHEEYLALQADYAESVDALGRAIQEMSKQDYSRPQAEMLLQQLAKTTPGMKRVLAAFLQQSAHQDGAPAVAAYEFQSGGIIAVLDGLLEKFKKELDDVESQESNQAHNYDLEMIHLSNVIAKSKSDREEKSATKARKMEASAKAKGELADTKAEKAEDQKYIQDMTATFEAKTRTYEANQEVRRNELEALAKAIEIISAPDVAGSYAGHINLVEVTSKGSASFLQMRRSSRRVSVRQHAAEYLQRRAKSLSSKVLLSVAAEIAGNPFEKVVSMIQDLIAKLKEEAAAEADHKAWCDDQLHKNKLKRDKRTASVEKLSAEIEALAGQIAEMGQEIETLAAQQAELTKAMAEATEQRQTEKAKNEHAIADAQAGSEAVKQAIVVLREFYSSQAGFLQVRRQVPEMAAYKGMQNSKTGVVGMLEVIQSDFMRLEADTKSAETLAAREYDEFMTDAKADKLQKHEAEVKLKLDKDQSEFDKSQLSKDLAANEEELAKANEYYEYLKPNCLEVKVNYEDRVARRKEEIEALKEAYKILNSKPDA
jgi:hypothetical protein